MKYFYALTFGWSVFAAAAVATGHYHITQTDTTIDKAVIASLFLGYFLREFDL